MNTQNKNKHLDLVRQWIRKYLPGFYDAQWDPELAVQLPEHLRILIGWIRPLLDQEDKDRLPLGELANELAAAAGSLKGFESLDCYLAEELYVLNVIRVLLAEADRIYEKNLRQRERGTLEWEEP
jgi:hypothetical protein